MSFKNLIYILLIVLFISCNDDFKDIDYDNKIVVEGWIEQNDYAKVLLTLSTPYFSEIDSVSIRELVLTRARVSISDGKIEDILTLKPNDDYFPPYVYQGTIIKGEIGKIYTLKVVYNSQEITAETTIPEVNYLDSVWFALDEEEDSLGFLWARFTDNPNEINYYRLLTQRLSVDTKYVPTFMSNYDDKMFDGQTVDFIIFKGKSNPLEKDDDTHFTLGDTIMLKVCTINEQTYKFWKFINNELHNAGNPLASSNATLVTNINGGLGIWAGYGVSKYMIIAKNPD